MPTLCAPGSEALLLSRASLQRNLQALSADAAALGADLAHLRELAAAARQLAADTRATLRAQAAARKVHPEHTLPNMR